MKEAYETGGVGGSDSGTSVANGLVTDGELGEVVTGHLGLDLDGVCWESERGSATKSERRDRANGGQVQQLTEDLSVVDSDDASDHLGNDDHVTEVGLDALGLLASGSLLLGLAELLHEGHGLALKPTLEASASTSVDQLGEGSRVEVEELRELWVVEARRSARRGCGGEGKRSARSALGARIGDVHRRQDAGS